MESVIALAVASIGAIGSILAALVARRAEKNTRPVSNGFAGETLHRLNRIELLVTDHIQAHANSDLSEHRKRRHP